MTARDLWTAKYDATAERDTKFGSKPRRCSEDVWHQSTLEARRCTELHTMQKGGLIRELRAHPQERFNLDVNGVHVCAYLADFVYIDAETGDRVVEDTKGKATEVYKLKAKLMRALHGIEIQEVKSVRGRRW